MIYVFIENKVNLFIMYTFIHFKRNRGRDRDGGVKKEEERDQRWREKTSAIYLLHI